MKTSTKNILILLPIAVLVKGFVIAKVFGWTIATIWDLEPITTAQGVALSIFAMLFISSGKSSDEEKDLDEMIVYIFVYAAVMLLLGWCVSQFI